MRLRAIRLCPDDLGFHFSYLLTVVVSDAGPRPRSQTVRGRFHVPEKLAPSHAGALESRLFIIFFRTGCIRGCLRLNYAHMSVRFAVSICALRQSGFPLNALVRTRRLRCSFFARSALHHMHPFRSWPQRLRRCGSSDTNPHERQYFSTGNIPTGSQGTLITDPQIASLCGHFDL